MGRPPATSTSNQPGPCGHWNQPKTEQDKISMGVLDDTDASISQGNVGRLLVCAGAVGLTNLAIGVHDS